MFPSFYALFWSVFWLQTSVAWTDFIGRPHDFVKLFLDCIRDEDCHFYYWHISKCGGTSINYSMKHLYPRKGNIWAWDKAVMEFKKNVKSYCMSKWSSYEISGRGMRGIVETCMKLNPRSTAIVLFTYREPISRFVSWINYMCNKRLDWRSKETLNFCSFCNSSHETKEYLKKAVNNANDLYLSVSYITEINSTNVHVLSLDTQYLSAFLKSVSSQLRFNVKVKNVKKIDKCNFGATADIISDLVPSIGVYQRLIIEASA